jgi:uncharacterized membrane-anchored protein
MPNLKLLYAAVAVQLLILLGMVVKSTYPLLLGTPVEMEVMPRDPRDLFRGQYVALRYDFNTIDSLSLPNDLDTGRVYSFGTPIYLTLKKDINGYCVPAGMWHNIPDKKLHNNLPVLKTILQNDVSLRINSYSTYLYLKAGIEDYFCSPQEAQTIEQAIFARGWDNENVPDSLRVVATVFIAPDGQGRINGLRYTPPKANR